MSDSLFRCETSPPKPATSYYICVRIGVVEVGAIRNTHIEDFRVKAFAGCHGIVARIVNDRVTEGRFDAMTSSFPYAMCVVSSRA